MFKKYTKIKTYGILFLLSMYSFGLSAQHIVGTVINKSNGKPIKNAQIYNAKGNLLASTKADGSFISKNLRPGTYTITVFSYEFKLLKKTVKIIDKNSVVPIALSPLNQQLSEIILQKRQKKIFTLKHLKAIEGTAIYAGKKTEVILLDQTMGNKASNNARQIYAQVVGLNIYENDDAGLQLNIGGRGLDPNRTANFNTRQNGYDISAEVLGYPESYYTPPAEALSEIQVVRGAASLQYGTQFGGLLNFKFKKPNKYRPFSLVTRQSVGSFGVFTSFNSISGTVDKTGYYAYFNYKKGNGFRPNSKFDAKNIYVHITHHFSKKTALTVESTHLNYLVQQPGGLTDWQFNRNPKFSNRT
ncbi:MAG: carboxypeptidase regulatory-like domain-containing protein, partial [Polaribacter sp.]